ncbi:exported protein of unknown function [Maridesulfovibrio hydrothermalis AM13 = DSM 14728]|uniref:Uncharacterized protein n=3 Tax=Maridesulfovibrio TaxID=2794998 RepID=L0RBV6_9BACT|nr:exported protein of unknown function [Maridesulfovibrio hydrothermalis AM13 = DSM 14728]
MRFFIFVFLILASVGTPMSVHAGKDVLLSIANTANTFGTVNPCPT